MPRDLGRLRCSWTDTDVDAAGGESGAWAAGLVVPLWLSLPPDAPVCVDSLGTAAKRRVGEVFVVGRLPRITYNPRSDRGLENDLRTYLDDRGTILSVSGATKTGKTVLLRSVAPGAISLSGGAIESVVRTCGSRIAEKLGLWGEVSTSNSSSESDDRTWTGKGNVGFASVERAGKSQTGTGHQDSLSRTISPAVAARGALSGNQQVLVIDDFHYVDRDVQLGVVRGPQGPRLRWPRRDPRLPFRTEHSTRYASRRK